jgi:hypothetical protein
MPLSTDAGWTGHRGRAAREALLCPGQRRAAMGWDGVFWAIRGDQRRSPTMSMATKSFGSRADWTSAMRIDGDVMQRRATRRARSRAPSATASSKDRPG